MFKKDKEKDVKVNSEDVNSESEKDINENPFMSNNNESDEEIKEQETSEKTDNELQIKYDALNNQYIRLAADFDNYRKRQAQERESLLKYGAEDTLKKLIPIVDTFERAKASVDKMEDPEQLKESFDVLNKQFVEALEKVGLKKIETVGKEFDPNMHEAVMQTPTSEHSDQSVIAEMQSGYMLNDRVLRAAMVNVAVSE